MEQLVSKGYAVVERVFDPAMVEILSAAAESLFARTYAEPVLFDPKGRIARINGLLAYAGADLLTIVGGPAMRDLIARAGIQTPVPVLESLVVKRPGDAQDFLWHQDFVHGRVAPALVFGIYLDPSVPFEGAVQFVPGSQAVRHDMGELAADVAAGKVAVESPALNPGDVLIHDVMVAHGSAPVPEGGRDRRVLYFEIHDAAVVRESAMGTEEDIAVKRGLFEMCHRAADENWQTVPDDARDRLRTASFHRFRNPSAANYAA
ncbi:MAG: phytanoyl-CoA dioxygenase family protein [Alphaproteobacteria bacterium]|nr:phytanoyl-CoA dioxygenase family protein [Alphaproteobacteria bacterium]